MEERRNREAAGLIIRNMDELTSHGNIEGRREALCILEAGLEASDPYDNTRKLIRIQDGKLIVGHKDFIRRENPSMLTVKLPLQFDLSEIGSVYVVGGGKAAQRMAKAMEDALGDLITDGQINAKKGEPLMLRRIKVTFAGHPMPDEDSIEGARRIMEIEQKARKGDIVFLSLSGGASALTALPGPGLSLKDIQDVTRMLYFQRGASMPETNAVRGDLIMLRHERLVGDATLIQFVTEEFPPEIPLARIHAKRSQSLSSSYSGAIEVLKRFQIWDLVPRSVRLYLEKSDPEYGPIRREDVEGRPRYYFRPFGPEYMLEGARRRADEKGISAHVLVSSLNDIEARAVGDMMAFIAQEVEVNGRPFKPPCVILFGGESRVAIGDSTGRGGRNQEFVLSAAPRVEDSRNIVVASADSDGTDGPTDVAGGLVDGYTMERTRKAELNVFDELGNHNSHEVLARLGDTIITGALSTNVRGLGVVYVAGMSGPLRQ